MTTQNDIAIAEAEVDKNYKHFLSMLPEWQSGHLSDYTLIHHQQLVDFYESKNDAIRTGIREFGWGHFSVQSVRNRPIDLGYQSHVLFGSPSPA